MGSKYHVGATNGRTRTIWCHCEPVRRLAWQSPKASGRLIPLVLSLILLTGCAPQAAPKVIPETAPVTIVTAPPETTAPQETTPPPETIPWQEPDDESLVRVLDYIPGIYQSLPYATEENFTGQVIYDFSDVYLRYGTVKKLAQAWEALQQEGYSLLIWDGFRPTAAQWKLWGIYPDATYVSDPTAGYSSHSRGNTVDVTLVYADGTPVEMPTGFDDFTPYADRDYSDCTPEAAKNARLLENTMKEVGFSAYFGEWWHFTDTDSHEVAEDFSPITTREITLTAETALFSKADMASAVLAWLEPGETVTCRAISGEFSLVEALGGWGYILSSKTKP